MDGVPVHQLLSLASPGLLICVNTNFGIALALKKALRIFGAVEAGLRGRWVDFVTERVQSNGYSAADIFSKLPSLWGFVDCDCGLVIVSRSSMISEANNLLQRLLISPQWRLKR
jgi:hypothetical protein